MLTEFQRRKHHSSITASKIGGILGLSPWQSKFSVYHDMKSSDIPEDISSMRTKFGWYAESAISRYLEEEEHWKLMDVPEEGFTHPEYPFIWCLPDKLRIVDESYPTNVTHVMEYKNIDSIFLRDWEENGVPQIYVSQVYMQMLVCNLPGILVALFGGNTPKIWFYERNKNIEDFLLATAIKFYDDLVNDREPEVDGHQATSLSVNKLYDEGGGAPIEGTAETRELLRELHAAEEAAKKLTEEAEKFKNLLKISMKDADTISWSDGSMVSWKKDRPSKVVDNELLKNNYPEVYEAVLKDKKQSRRFKYRIKKGEES